MVDGATVSALMVNRADLVVSMLPAASTDQKRRVCDAVPLEGWATVATSPVEVAPPSSVQYVVQPPWTVALSVTVKWTTAGPL